MRSSRTCTNLDNRDERVDNLIIYTRSCKGIAVAIVVVVVVAVVMVYEVRVAMKYKW